MEIDSPDHLLALAYAGKNREKLRVLLAFDARLMRLVATAREPMIAQIKLAWWRDQLVEPGSIVNKREPLLAAIHELAAGPALVPVVNGWEAVLGHDPVNEADLASFAQGRGKGLFQVAQPGEAFASSGCRWALMDFAGRCPDVETALRARAMARQFPVPNGLALPLGILIKLAESDLPPSSPRRMLRALSYVITRR